MNGAACGACGVGGSEEEVWGEAIGSAGDGNGSEDDGLWGDGGEDWHALKDADGKHTGEKEDEDNVEIHLGRPLRR